MVAFWLTYRVIQAHFIILRNKSFCAQHCSPWLLPFVICDFVGARTNFACTKTRTSTISRVNLAVQIFLFSTFRVCFCCNRAKLCILIRKAKLLSRVRSSWTICGVDTALENPESLEKMLYAETTNLFNFDRGKMFHSKFHFYLNKTSSNLYLLCHHGAMSVVLGYVSGESKCMRR